MLSDKKPVSKRKTKTLAYSSYFKQKVGQESNELATELTRNFTEGRISRSRRISHGLTRNFTEKTRKRRTQIIDPKVQMEELQWGFPIATPLSFNKLT